MTTQHDEAFDKVWDKTEVSTISKADAKKFWDQALSYVADNNPKLLSFDKGSKYPKNTIVVYSTDSEGNIVYQGSRSSFEPHADVSAMDAALEFKYALRRGVKISPQVIANHVAQRDSSPIDAYDDKGGIVMTGQLLEMLVAALPEQVHWNDPLSPNIALELFLAGQESAAPCSYCGNEGVVDSGGVYPWGESINQPCNACGPRRHAIYSLQKHRTFQNRVRAWFVRCFGDEALDDQYERVCRFLEEGLELAQSCGLSDKHAHELVDYVFTRPAGERPQEVGGVMTTLAMVCNVYKLDMLACGETELRRVWTVIDKIRAKQASKPKNSPLPGAST